MTEQGLEDGLRQDPGRQKPVDEQRQPDPGPDSGPTRVFPHAASQDAVLPCAHLQCFAAPAAGGRSLPGSRRRLAFVALAFILVWHVGPRILGYGFGKGGGNPPPPLRGCSSRSGRRKSRDGGRGEVSGEERRGGVPPPPLLGVGRLLPPRRGRTQRPQQTGGRRGRRRRGGRGRGRHEGVHPRGRRTRAGGEGRAGPGARRPSGTSGTSGAGRRRRRTGGCRAGCRRSGPGRPP